MWTRFRGLFGPDPARDVDEELAFHLEMRVQELIAAGETPERARELALHRFGSVEGPRDACVTIMERRGRSMARSEYIAELRQDVAYAVRSLGRRPGFTLVAVLTLALGIGANSAIFSVVNGVLLQPLPWTDADRLYEVQMVYPDGARYPALSPPDFMSVAERVRSFDAIVALDVIGAPLLGAGEPRQVDAGAVSRGYLETLGIPLALGRGFDPAEHEPGASDVALLTWPLWQRDFGGRPDVVGHTVTYFGREFRIIGVLAAEARLPAPVELVVPIPYGEAFSATAEAGRRSEYLYTFGRARPGLTEEQVEAELQAVSLQLAAEFPATNERLRMGVVSVRERTVGDVRRPLLVLLGAVAFVLLVACANVANLLLARGSARRGELAVRAALGAGRGRLVRQLLTESLVLGVAGGAAGLLVAWLGTGALVAAQPADIPRLDTVRVDGTVVLVTAAVAVLTALLFGMAPALQATRGAASPALREGGRGGQPGGNRLRAALVVSEMALAVMLLVGAGLLIRSFVGMTRVDPGFETSRALSFQVSFDRAAYPEGHNIRDFVGRLLEGVDALPGVESVAGTAVLPLRGRGALINFDVEGAPPPPDDVNREIGYYGVTPGYFATIGARIVAGRDLSTTDHADAPPVALINQAGARFWFPGEDPVGRFVQVGATTREIVGVVSDVLHRNPQTAVQPQLFAPYAQQTSRRMQVVVRPAGDPAPLAPSLRSLVRSMDPTMPISAFSPLDRLMAEAVARPRFYTMLLTLFAAAALVLAAIGIFGVMSYSVAQRAGEISVRMALGARPGAVVRMVVGRSMALAGLGLTAGLVGAAMLGRVLQSQLFGVTVLDPFALAGAALVLAGSAFVASWLPARRAAAVDPGAALREG